MRKLIFLLSIFSLMACADDDFLRNDFERQRNNEIAETTPEGLKLKSKGALYYTQFFHNKNGFVDSTYSSDSWHGYNEVMEKYIYNKQNQIVECKIYYSYPHYPQSNRQEITYYNYNEENQIISRTTYDQNKTAIAYQTFTYNRDGSLFNPSLKIVNENVVKEGGVTYEFDNTRNPLYNIYPKAYRILHAINKNNITLTKYSQSNYHEHTLRYNDVNYIVEEKISNMPTDTNDHIGYLYY